MDSYEVVQEPELYRVEEVAQRLRVGRTTVFGLIRSGRLRSVKIGAARRVTPAALAEYVAELEREAVA